MRLCTIRTGDGTRAVCVDGDDAVETGHPDVGALLTDPDCGGWQRLPTGRGPPPPSTSQRSFHGPGAGFADIPVGVLTALVDDVVRTWTQRGELPDVTLRVDDRCSGSGSVELRGSLVEAASTLTGRTVALDTGGVTLPRWL